MTVKNSTIKGNISPGIQDGLTLINCRIIGTQSLCYCRNLKLIDCEMEGTDLAFEKSEVQADILTPVVSIKNPLSGSIRVPAAGGKSFWTIRTQRAKSSSVMRLPGKYGKTVCA